MSAMVPQSTVLRLEGPMHGDRRIVQAVSRALVASGYREVAQIECRAVDGLVILEGTVSSYFLKQVAQAIVLQLKVATRLQNDVHVAWR